MRIHTEFTSRILQWAVSLFLVFLLFAGSRAVIRFLPGDPLETLVAETGTSLPRAQLAAELGLDRPYLTALAQDVGNALRGDFGKSLHSREPILPLIVQRTAQTLWLVIFTLIVGIPSSVYLGAMAGSGSRWARYLSSLWGASMAALPMPVLAPLLLYGVATWLPSVQTRDNVMLPALALSLGWVGSWSRLIRNQVEEYLHVTSSVSARARGLSESTILWKYAVRPSAPALIGYLGTQIGYLLGGAVVTEMIFDWPGMGSLFIESVLKRDYPLVEACVFWMAASTLLGTGLGDWLQKRWDPRL